MLLTGLEFKFSHLSLGVNNKLNLLTLLVLIYFVANCQAFATPRELLLRKVPFPLPTPSIFNLDLINSWASDTLVSENG